MELSLEDEDSLTERFDKKKEGLIDIAVIRYPRISNFTDFNVFEQMEEVTVRYVTSISELGHPDMVILPGSKNTMGDLKWMRQNGLEAAVKKLANDIPVFGICGGYQMLGNEISDPNRVEEGGKIRGMELLPIKTILKNEKKRCQIEGRIDDIDGSLSELSGCEFRGYEIHMGESFYDECVGSICAENANDKYKNGEEDNNINEKKVVRNVVSSQNNTHVYGSYVHGLFDTGEIAARIVQKLAENKGVKIENGKYEDYQTFKEKQYDKLADTLRLYLDMEEIYGMLREAKL